MVPYFFAIFWQALSLQYGFIVNAIILFLFPRKLRLLYLKSFEEMSTVALQQKVGGFSLQI